jgi:hypothetical protein
MSTYRECTKCGERDLIERHRCKARWKVHIKDYHDFDDPGDGIDAWSDDAEDAARDSIEQWDDDRGALDSPFLVRVTPINQEPGCAVEWFQISAEASVDYYARPVNEPS